MYFHAFIHVFYSDSLMMSTLNTVTFPGGKLLVVNMTGISLAPNVLKSSRVGVD